MLSDLETAKKHYLSDPIKHKKPLEQLVKFVNYDVKLNRYKLANAVRIMVENPGLVGAPRYDEEYKLFSYDGKVFNVRKTRNKKDKVLVITHHYF